MNREREDMHLSAFSLPSMTRATAARRALAVARPAAPTLLPVRRLRADVPLPGSLLFMLMESGVTELTELS